MSGDRPEDVAAGRLSATRIGREQGWGVVERRRCDLAERVARELAFAVPGPLGSLPGGVSGVLAKSAITVTLGSTAELQWALADMPTVISVSRGQATPLLGCVGGPAGKVLFNHFDDHSVVFSYLPFTGVIVVCTDDVDGYCLVLDDDSPRTFAAVEGFRDDLAQRFASLREDGVAHLLIDD